jgi:acyl-CoA reductase-like NAD-dependent aldehyde dehydrogenase
MIPGTTNSAAPPLYDLYIDGAWVPTAEGRTFPSKSPSSGETLALIAEGDREDARRAIAAANAARDGISGLSAWDRAGLCRKIAEVMQSRADRLARVLAAEQGKPLEREARAEVAAAILGFEEAAEHIKWLETAVIPVQDPNKRVHTFYQPRGVYAVITPWNFPLNIPVEYLSAGLAAGNAMVWVPAPTTSLCAIELTRCFEEAEVPPGVINLVTGFGPVVGDEIVANPGTDAVTFTGSSATGETIARRSAGKPLLLELGGNGPTIVLDDADLTLAVSATANSCFFNAGQVCSAAERILVQDEIHDEFIDRLTAEARQVRLGDPFDASTTMGPLNNPHVASKTDRHVADSVARGSSVVIGGSRATGFRTDLFYLPTIVDHVSEDSLLNSEETFGPVAPVIPVSSDAEALRVANTGNLGLVSAVFTTSLRRAYYFGERLRTGIVNVNDTSNYWELHIPFGGVAGKRSGIGRLGGKHTIMSMSDLRTMCIDLR